MKLTASDSSIESVMHVYRNPTRVLGLLALLATALPTVAYSQESVRQIPLAETVDETKEATDTVKLVGLEDEYVIEGEVVYPSYFLGAKRIVFKSGARLIFSKDAVQSTGKLIVVAETIVSEDPSKPGAITWQFDAIDDSLAPIAGQAATGANGHGESAPGQPGAQGAQGNVGYAGIDAPNLTIYVLGFDGAPPLIEMRGQNGGVGGEGQRGGDGGLGANGVHSSSNVYKCKRKAGGGGSGGVGGVGGSGGVGGRGGLGGTVTFVSTPEVFPTMLELIRADASGGVGGPGGVGGSGGSGGTGGEGGHGSTHCHGGPHGPTGSVGQAGGQGNPGEPGAQGEVLFSIMKLDAFKANFGL